MFFTSKKICEKPNYDSVQTLSGKKFVKLLYGELTASLFFVDKSVDKSVYLSTDCL